MISLPLLLLGQVALAQSFSDRRRVGRLVDARRQPTDLKVGPHQFEPSIVYKLFGVTTPHVLGAATLGWNDNFLRADGDVPGVRERAEPFSRFHAGARLDTELTDHRLELDYRVIVTELIDTGRYDTLEQRARARLDLFWLDLEAHGDVSWSRSSYPQSIQLTGIVELESTGARLWTEGRLGSFGLRVGGHVRRHDYLDGDLSYLDHLYYGADVQLYGRIQPKLRGLVEYNWYRIEFEEGRRGWLNDYDVHRIQAGIDGELTPKLSASLKAGASLQLVDPGPNPDTRQFTGFSARTSLHWEPLAWTGLTLSYTRRISVSVSTNYLLDDDVWVRIKQKLFSEEVEGTLEGGYTHSEVDRDERVERWRARAAVRYQIRQWLSLVGEYELLTVDSSTPGSDYQVHTLSISLGVGL